MQMIDSTIIDFDGRKYDASQVEDLKKWIEEQMIKFKDKYKDTLSNENTYSADNEIWQVWDVLNQILMRLNGISRDLKLILNHGLKRNYRQQVLILHHLNNLHLQTFWILLKLMIDMLQKLDKRFKRRVEKCKRAFAELYKEKG